MDRVGWVNIMSGIASDQISLAHIHIYTLEIDLILHLHL